MPFSTKDEDDEIVPELKLASYSNSENSKSNKPSLSIYTGRSQHKRQESRDEKAVRQEKKMALAAITEAAEAAGAEAKVSPRDKFKTAAIAVSHNNEEIEVQAEGVRRNTFITSDPVENNWARVGYGAKVAALRAKQQRAVTNEKLFSRAVVSATTWDVWSPPPGNSLSGKVVPRLMNKHKHRRKCSLEIHRVTPLTLEADADGNEVEERGHSYHECVVRIMVPATAEDSRKVKLEALKDLANQNHNSNLETFTSVRQIRFDSTTFVDDDDDDQTVDTTSSSVRSSRYPMIKDNGGREYDGWKPRYCIPMHGIFVRAQHRKTVTILISFSNFKQERDLIFDSTDDARAFVKQVEKQQRLEIVRQDDRLKTALAGELTLPKFEKLTLLFEIVAGYNLEIGDFTSSDPYVIAYMGHREIHRTDFISKTLNPVWTLSTGSLFLLNVESKRFFIEGGLKFVVKDYDRVGRNDVLGICKVDPKVFYKAKGERMEFKLTPPRVANAGSRDGPDDSAGVLVVRCRRATPYDEKFMADFAKQESKNAKGVASYDAPEADTSALKTLTTKVKRRTASGDMEYKLRPFPDPQQPTENTEWMTDAAIQEAVLEPSHHWVEMGEGSLGKIYLEILGCDGLPNMDNGAFYGNKTDTFVSCVFEDVYGRTDVIDDCLSPRWLPWTNRAFICRMEHPSSFLNLGIFDYDNGLDRLDDHDLIGRVSVDLTNLRSATEYVLSYNICPTTRLNDRRSLGKIMIRLRMDVPDERRLAMAVLYPPPPIYVNTKNRKDFQVIRKTCFGSVDEERYSQSTLKSYIDEVYQLQYALFFVEDSFKALLLWRGQVEWMVPYFDVEVNLPIHSIIVFALSTFLVEHPMLIPSFCFGSLAWLLLAVGTYRRGSENVWYQCHSYTQIFKMIVLGDDFAEPHKIEPFENYENAKKETEDWVKRIEESEHRAAMREKEAMEAEKERQKELKELGEIDTELGTPVNNTDASYYNMVRNTLYPIQLCMGLIVRVKRMVSNILTWQEAYFSFWITTCSLVLAIVSLFVPWLWCLKWGSRIFVWTIFGPWMKLVDIFYFSLIEPETDEQRQLRRKAEKLAQKLSNSDSIIQARTARENAVKLKAMKTYMFGKYALRVPVLKTDRYNDIPLAESFANPYEERNFSLGELAMQEAGYNKKRVPGQTLVGDMIPYVKEEDFTSAPVGKAALNPQKLSRFAPGSRSKGSIVTNPRKILVAVALAVGITYYGTSLVASALAKTDRWIAGSGEEL